MRANTVRSCFTLAVAVTVIGLFTFTSVCFAFPDANHTRYSVPDAASFFEGVNLEYPGLEKVAAAVAKKDYSAAIEAYCSFVAKREKPRLYPKDMKFEGNVARADREIKVYLKDGKLREDLVWLGKPAQRYAFRNRMGYLSTIARAYAETGDAKYLNAFRVIIAAWIKAHPLGIKIEPGVATPWHILDVSARSHAWTYALRIVQRSPEFTVKERFEIYRTLMQHRKILEHYNSRTFRLGNFRTTALKGNLMLTLKFPEWKDAEKSRKHCMALLGRHLTEGVNADGFQSEMTPNYHFHVMNGFRGAQRLVHDVNGLPGFSDEALELLNKGYWLLDVLRKPNGALPAIGDAPRRGDVPNAAPKEGVKVDYVSRRLPASGLVLMKSGTEHMDALYLLFDNAPAGSGTHSHWDYLNIELFGYGRTLLHDPSTGLYYREPKHDGYYKSTMAHNVVVVDGKSSIRFIRDRKRIYNDAWQSTETFDYARGVLKGYADVDHVREVLFVKGRYWVVRDTILGNGEHTMAQRFKFDPGTLKVDEAAKGVTSTYNDTANLSIIPANSEGLTVTVEKGWLADKNNKRHIETPVAQFARKGNTTISATVVLFPHKKGETRAVKVVDYVETDTSISFTVDVDNGKQQDKFVFEKGPYRLVAAHDAEANSFKLEAKDD